MSSYHKHTLIIGTLTTLSCWYATAHSDPTKVNLDAFYRYRQVQGNYYGDGIEKIPEYLEDKTPSIEPTQIIYHKKTTVQQEVPFADGIVIRRVLGGYRPESLGGKTSYCSGSISAEKKCSNQASLDFMIPRNNDDPSQGFIINKDIGLNATPPTSLPYKGPFDPYKGPFDNVIQWHLHPYLNSGYCMKDMTLHLGLVPWAAAVNNGYSSFYGNINPPSILLSSDPLLQQDQLPWASDITATDFQLSRGIALLDKFIFSLRQYAALSETDCSSSPTARRYPDFSLMAADSGAELKNPTTFTNLTYDYIKLYNTTLRELQRYFPQAKIAPAEIGYHMTTTNPDGTTTTNNFYIDPSDYVNKVDADLKPPSYIAKQLYGNLGEKNNTVKSNMPWGRINAANNFFDSLDSGITPKSDGTIVKPPHEIHQFRFQNTQPSNQARNASWTFQVLMGLKAGYYSYSSQATPLPTTFHAPPSTTIQRVFGWATTTGGDIGENLLLGNGFVYALFDRYRLAGDGVGSQILPLRPASVKKYNTSENKVSTENDVSTQASAIAFTNPNDNTLRSIVIATFGIGSRSETDDPLNNQVELNFPSGYSKVELRYSYSVPANFQNKWKAIEYTPDTYVFYQIKNDLAHIKDGNGNPLLDGNGNQVSYINNTAFPDNPTNSFATCKFCDDDPVEMTKGSGNAAKTYLQNVDYATLMKNQLKFDDLPADQHIKVDLDNSSNTLTITATIPTDAVIVLEPQP